VVACKDFVRYQQERTNGYTKPDSRRVSITRNRTLSPHTMGREPFLRRARADSQDEGEGVLREGTLGRRQWAVNPGDCQQFQGAEVLSGREMIKGGTTETCFGFVRPNIQDVVALNGPSNLLTISSSSEHK